MLCGTQPGRAGLWLILSLALGIPVGCDGGDGTVPTQTPAPTSDPVTDTPPFTGETNTPRPETPRPDVTDTPRETQTPQPSETLRPGDTPTPMEATETLLPPTDPQETGTEVGNTTSPESTQTPSDPSGTLPEVTPTPDGNPTDGDTPTPGASATPFTDQDRDGSPLVEDCDDTNPDVYPGAVETCDGKDNDCDNLTDEDGQSLYYADGDVDGYGAGEGVAGCNLGAGYSTLGSDCDDNDPLVNPAATEVCDGNDENCDGQIDEGTSFDGYADDDGDGFGAGEPVTVCLGTPDYVGTAGDCDDNDAAINPAATETCNLLDDDCDDVVDNGVTQVGFSDGDGDGYGVGEGKVVCLDEEGYAAQGGDCDDKSPSVNPGATEVCNAQDDNCDGATDEGTTVTAYTDGDSDGYGTGEGKTQCPNIPGFAIRSGDCNDSSSAINPGATEVCDNIDNNCSGSTDEGVTVNGFPDGDNDTYGTGGGIAVCPGTAGYATRGGDCNDTNANINPGASEVCDGKDNDCDNNIDEGVTTTGYVDNDADSYGTGSLVTYCPGISGYASRGGDCNDGNATIYPGATELCDAKDNDCDGQTDEGATATAYVDKDGDGFGTGTPITSCPGTGGYAGQGGDCNDNNAAIYPGANETCDGKDNDCDNTIDEGVTSTGYVDADGDTYGAGSSVSYCSGTGGYSSVGGDCNDTNATINPGAAEVCDAKDNNCNSQIDEGVTTTYYQDSDADGYGTSTTTQNGCSKPTGYSSTGGDCDDTKAAINPGAAEVCDTKDNNCDSQIDEGVTTTWYKDTDGDGYGSAATTTQACSAPAGYVANSSDCNDTNAAIKPGATEVCNSVDDNCNNQIDEGVQTNYYRDGDGDGYGAGSATPACTPTTGYATTNTDCNDGNANINPGAYDLPGNGVDEDCDGADDTAVDLDQDGYPDMIVPAYYNNTSYLINSAIYYGSASGYVNTNRTDLPTRGARGVCVADFDEDGWLDVVFANYYDGTTYTTNSYLYWGSPSGFSTSDRLDLPTIGALSCSVGDLEGDGDQDLVFSNFYNGTTYSLNSYIYINKNGGFARADRVDVPTDGTQENTIADLDGDGLQEIIFSCYRNGTTYNVNSYIYKGSSAGYSAANRVSLPTIGAWRRAAVADLNDDGDLDIVMPNHFNGTATTGYSVNSYVYYSPNYGTDTRVSLATTGAANPFIEDLDQDGFPDIFFPSYYDGDDAVTSFVYYGSSRGYSSSNRQTLPSGRVYMAATDDLNDDGFTDLALGVYYDGDYSTTSKVYLGSSIGYSSAAGAYWDLKTIGVGSIDVADFDNDGWADIGVGSWRDGDADYASTGYLFYGSPRGIPTSNRTDLSHTAGSRKVLARDLNGDGYPEAIVAGYYTGASYSTNSVIYWGTALGPSNNKTTTLPTLGAVDICVADFNGDNRQDVVFANSYSGTSYQIDSYVYWGTSSGYSTSSRTSLPTIGALSCHVDDLDGDGDLDLAFGNYYSGSSYKIDSYIYFNTSGNFSTLNRTSIPGIGVSGMSSADLNGDGLKDLVLSNYYDGTTYVNPSYIYFGNPSGFSTSYRVSLTTDGVYRPAAIKDLNKDNRLDLTFFGYYDGDETINSYVYWNSNVGFTQSNKSTLAGNRTRDGKIADVDLDGYQDIVMGTYYDGDDTVNNYVYFGSSAGFSTANRQTLPSNRVVSMDLTDVDLDGYPDMVLGIFYDADYSTTSYIYFGSSTGFSSTNRSALATGGTWDVEVEDFDQDGLDDILFGSYGNAGDARTSYLYWNSLRGFASTNASSFTSNGCLDLTFVP